MADKKRGLARAAATELAAALEPPSKRAKVHEEAQTPEYLVPAAPPRARTTRAAAAAAGSPTHKLDAEEELLRALEADVAQQEERGKAVAPAHDEDEDYDESDGD